ncbi:collagen alpha 1(II) chain precursor, partial [Carbonactinospora thermoautotrophica]
QERERSKRPSYLVEDEETWRNKRPVVPPVIE